ncbi:MULTISPECIES: hypothetical protein [unclassified Streptomyces]|uniref:hypothetical protein n=1 Tax=unclassified Streptomyces TaxID=2593676 RepID=UPI00035D3852|nr:MULTISPECIES: hypothetical protein [unclassified Streptomyces]MYS36322.1 hypothetical protein [Streptomyces sp. SID4920]MYX63691.1 hypothetical protein [Streptomyces sp. SID8373]
MTKNGSNARKARIRAQANKAGATYRQAARTIDDDRAAWIAATRAICHSPEQLRDARDIYLMSLSEDGADLPETVKICLYALTDRLGTGTLIDPRGVSCTVDELAAATGLTPYAAEHNIYLARAHGWIANVGSQEYTLTVPGEDVDIYESLLQRLTPQVRDATVYQQARDRLIAATRR